MSRCVGAEREHSQTDSPSWPMEIVCTIDIMLSLCMGVGQAAGIFLSCFYEFESTLIQEFKLLCEFGLFQEFCEI